ncbi:Isopenicillin N synthase [Pseudobacteriovorax antillogorgiicola]|uniref:2-oxoglutarate-dependent ethylene/succinate-forming enzyme n=1 Tax=Pseudobacteriovorax antillogorgiicola TaxID=1513793 RepID=A0A1Y6BZB9_9BACT|nr:isopenicillin N synthase-like dioxygenase [Pseudobacteriovorax antillogorgiicola]SMF37169.1 Isopenicillin N synthase [Pseudobacteriovorax antillogorgiicola]
MTNADDIPNLNVGRLLSTTQTPTPEIIQRFLQTFQTIGFAYIENHGIQEAMIKDILRLSQAFFALPKEQKMALHMKHSGYAWRGYFPVGDELTSGIPDQKEGIYFGEEHSPDHQGVQDGWPLHGQNLWPSASGLEDFPKLVRSYMAEMKSLGEALMRGFALALGLEQDYFAKRFAEPTSLFRIFNYPEHQWQEKDDQWGVREHTDMGFLTILKQDESGGLEAKSRNGEWLAIPPRPGTFVINIGDMLEFWTHGIFRATPHRVKNQARGDRLSLPYFYDPCWTANLQPIDKALLGDAVPNQNDPERWDGLKLHTLNPQSTYGDFVWNKVRHVFPQLDQQNESSHDEL